MKRFFFVTLLLLGSAGESWAAATEPQERLETEEHRASDPALVRCAPVVGDENFRVELPRAFPTPIRDALCGFFYLLGKAAPNPVLR